jgi:glycerol uptake facilitator-like aquaporin
MFLLGKLSALKFLIYAVAQFLGAFIAAVFVYLTYLNALRKYPGGVYSIDTAGIFATYLNDKITDGNMFLNFFDQFFSTALFIIAILAITDKKNTEIPHQTVAILIGLALVVIGAAFGHNCGFAVIIFI